MISLLQERTDSLPHKIEEDQSRHAKCGANMVDLPMVVHRLSFTRNNECEQRECDGAKYCAAVRVSRAQLSLCDSQKEV
jgi:hypothetical protein